MSKDFSKIKALSESSVYKELISTLESENASRIGAIDMANINHYQQRIYRPEAENTREEQFIYYSYFKMDEIEYIVQYFSNYTVLEGQKDYMMIGDLQPQEVCRDWPDNSYCS